MLWRIAFQFIEPPIWQISTGFLLTDFFQSHSQLGGGDLNEIYSEKEKNTVTTVRKRTSINFDYLVHLRYMQVNI